MTNEPAIVIAWSNADQRWLATSVTGVPDDFAGVATGDGKTPADALQTLLEMAFLCTITPADATPIELRKLPR